LFRHKLFYPVKSGISSIFYVMSLKSALVRGLAAQFYFAPRMLTHQIGCEIAKWDLAEEGIQCSEDIQVLVMLVQTAEGLHRI
jgi:hypothetical protein